MVGITRNETSRRYVSDTPEFWSPYQWRLAADNKKQGSSTDVYPDNDISYAYQETIRHTEDTYKMMLDKGICPEQARAILPQSMMTEWIETGSLAAAARIYKLRTEEHAQVEIQKLSEYFGEEVSRIAPVSWKYLINKT
jgi:thymidylate synthase (FAD)